MPSTDDPPTQEHTAQTNKLNNIIAQQRALVQQTNKILTLQRTHEKDNDHHEEEMHTLQSSITLGFETLENELKEDNHSVILAALNSLKDTVEESKTLVDTICDKVDTHHEALLDAEKSIVECVAVKAETAAKTIADAKEEIVECVAVKAATAAKTIADSELAVVECVESKAETAALALVDAKEEIVACVEEKAEAAAAAAKEELMTEITLLSTSLTSLQSTQEAILVQLSVLNTGLASLKESN